jgi:hypothetical protein
MSRDYDGGQRIRSGLTLRLRLGRRIGIGAIKLAENPGRNQHHGDGAQAADQHRRGKLFRYVKGACHPEGLRILAINFSAVFE